ncbi:hypothetical protein EUA81_03240 [TM7 phylum sp. oral taxon 356]|nr:hypothetical protein EUA81_03240 [TM7 phylum sp. oral taxon 356]
MMNPRKPLKPGDLLVDIRVNGRLVEKLNHNELVAVFAQTSGYQLIEGLRYRYVRFDWHSGEHSRRHSRSKLVHLEPPKVDRRRAIRINSDGVMLIGWSVMETGQTIGLSIRTDGMAVVE